jgi:elongation factor P
MAEMVSTNQFKNGMHVDVEGTVYRIVEFQHVKPGKGGAFVRTKLKAFTSGAVIERTFRAGEKFQRIITSYEDVQYLYEDGDDVVLMDVSNY